MWCCAGEGGSALPWSGLLSGVELSLSELLNVKQWHTGLWLLNFLGECSGCGYTVVSGVAGLKDKLSLVAI